MSSNGVFPRAGVLCTNCKRFVAIELVLFWWLLLCCLRGDESEVDRGFDTAVISENADGVEEEAPKE